MTIRGHYLRGALGGFLFGLALAIMLTLYGVIRLGELTGVWIILVATVLGVVWSFVAPQPKPNATPGPPPGPSAPSGPAW